MGLGKYIGQDRDYRQLGQLGRLQGDTRHNRHRAACAVDDLTKEHHVQQAEDGNHGQTGNHRIQECGSVVVHPLEAHHTRCTKPQEDALLDDGHIDALRSNLAAGCAVTLHNGDDEQHDVDAPDPRIAVFLGYLVISVSLFGRRHRISR